MRSTRLLVTAALSAALLVPIGAVGAVAGEDFTATLNLKAYTKTRDVGLTAGKQNVPSGKTVNAWFFSEDGSPDPAANAQGWKAAPTTYRLDAVDGEHTVYVWARATGGVVSERGSDTTFLDRVDPVIDDVDTTPAQAGTPPTITNRNVTLAIEASDPGEPTTGSGIGRYAVVNTATAPASGTEAWKLGPIPASVAHKVTKNNGLKTVYVFVRDRAGNVSAGEPVQFNLQIAGPTVVINTLANFTKVSNPAIQLIATPSANAQFLVKYTATNVQPTAPTVGAAGWKTAISSLALPATGLNYVWAWAKDDNGSISLVPAVDTIMWDNTAPAASFNITSSSPTTSRTVNISGSGLDNPGGSGVAKYAVKLGTGPVTNAADWKDAIPATFLLPTGNGVKTLALFVKDHAGNVSPVASDTITLNIPAPVMLTFNITPLYTNTLVNVPITKTQSVNAGAGGIAGYFFTPTNVQPLPNATGLKPAPTNVTLPAGPDGVRTVHIWIKDNNGTVSVASLNDDVFLDTVKPTASLAVTGDGTASPSLVVSGTDPGGAAASLIDKYALVVGPSPVAPAAASSAWKDTAAAATVTLVAGPQLVTAFTKDHAGNVLVSAANSKTVTVVP